MPDWLISILSGGGAVAIAIAIWRGIYMRGIKTGMTNARLNAINSKLLHEKILPECCRRFDNMDGRLDKMEQNYACFSVELSNLTGKVDTVLLILRENQKNSEKRHRL